MLKYFLRPVTGRGAWLCAAANAGEEMKSLTKVFESILLVGQIGFSLITPPLVFVWLAHLAQSRLGWGTWVMVAAIVIGILTGIVSVYRTVLPLLKERGGEKPKGRSFNDHI